LFVDDHLAGCVSVFHVGLFSCAYIITYVVTIVNKQNKTSGDRPLVFGLSAFNQEMRILDRFALIF
jgi:hypothetical protein